MQWSLRAALISICLAAVGVLSTRAALAQSAAPLPYPPSAVTRYADIPRIAAIQSGPTGDMLSALGSAPPVYLPLVYYADGFPYDSPIWAHGSTPADHEVALFRRRFLVEGLLANAELHIFADTRYEVWLDGVPVGRGPARFSEVVREYDVYDLGALQPGSHLIAALVQWAPNARRSASTTPMLQAHLQGLVGGELQQLVSTDESWRAVLSDGWRTDSVPVYPGLIGPTELSDLREIPADWMEPTFVDDGWSAAVVRAPSEPSAVRQRSIPLLEAVPLTPTVVSSGSLSPGRTIVEVVPPVAEPYVFTFYAPRSALFAVEILTESLVSISGGVSLDGKPLDWAKADASRPDVYLASREVAGGTHRLSFPNVPADGLTFSVVQDQIVLHTTTVQQGLHAGRRLLLAEPISDSSHAVLSVGEAGLSVEFAHLPAYIVLDLGRTVHGRIVAQVDGAAGDVVDIGWSERLWQGIRPLPYPGSMHADWNQTDSWVLDGTARSISTLDTRAGRYLLIAAWGEAPVRLGAIRVYEERYPATERGSFGCSNALFDQIWRVGVDTLYPNMTDAYTDTPWRERTQWWGDAYAEDRINSVAFGDTELLRRGLLFMAEEFTLAGRPPAFAPGWDEATHLLDYGMLWVQSIVDYWQRTGDRQLLIELYPVVQRFMSYLATTEDGATHLLDLPCGPWWETALVDWAGRTSRCGQSTALNALYFRTLQDAAMIADVVADPASALAWRDRATVVRQQVNTILYVPAEHRYVASIVDGQILPPSPHAQAWSLALGIVPESDVDGVANALLLMIAPNPGSPNVEIYGMLWVLEALGRGGRVPEALRLIENYYGRLISLGATTWWETFRADREYSASLSHGWGGAPTWFMSTYVLGARSTGPESWLVRPAFAGVDHASGRIPLGDRELQVQWEVRDCEDGDLEIVSPAGSSGVAVIPWMTPSTVVTLDGRVVWRNGRPLTGTVSGASDGIHVALGEGTHVLSVHRNCHKVYLPLRLP